jgi:hypothetical protein
VVRNPIVEAVVAQGSRLLGAELEKVVDSRFSDRVEVRHGPGEYPIRPVK